MTIILFRHAATSANELGRMAVGVPGPPLSAAGRASVIEAARTWQDHAPRQVLSSPATRAVETAQILFPRSEITTRCEIAEVDPGAWGLPDCADGAQLHADLMRRWEAGVDLGLGPTDGESGLAVIDRLLPVVSELRTLDERELVVMVTHFGVIRMLLAAFVQPVGAHKIPSVEFPSLLETLTFRNDQLIE